MTVLEARFSARESDVPAGAVEMIHGSGGRATAELVRNLFHRHLGNAFLAQGNDQAAFEIGAGRLVMTTDAHVIAPLFFPGGDIGSLASTAPSTTWPWRARARCIFPLLLCWRKGLRSPI